MCGIAVAINWEGATDTVRRLIEGMLHRGDVTDPVVSPTKRTAMCTRRLRIVDPTGGVQPKASADGRILVSFNGEIYNHHELRGELEALGVKFSSDSDTEVLANALAMWGVTALLRLNGMYAFVAYDLKTNEFLAARDPLGVKPLYVIRFGGAFLFCSEIKPLIDAVPLGDVLFLPPGHLLMKGLFRNFYAPRPSTSLQYSASTLDKLLDKAVASRLPTGLTAPVLFSGGIDSTLVLHYSRRYRPETPAYFIGNDNAPDFRFAKAYADITGSDIRQVTLDPLQSENLPLLEKTVEVTESFEPSVVHAGLYTYLLARRIHDDGYPVALCGEGADELFAGYTTIEHTYTHSPEAGRNIQDQCIDQMHRSNLQRLDRCGMRSSLEIREPFLDQSVIAYSRGLGREALIKMVDGLPQGKQPLREIYDLNPAQLPAIIRNRHKVVFSEGAGNGSERPAWRQMFEESISDAEFENGKREFVEFEINTKEEFFYLRALSRKLDIRRVPHLKTRYSLFAPKDLAPMPAEMTRLVRSAA